MSAPVSFQSRLVGVTHPVRSVPDVRRTDARRRKRDTPEGVAQGFQVSLYKVEPRVCVFARNLFSKDDWNAPDLAVLPDDPLNVRPQVPLIIKSSFFA
jgi:hypothetical protein